MLFSPCLGPGMIFSYQEYVRYGWIFIPSLYHFSSMFIAFYIHLLVDVDSYILCSSLKSRPMNISTAAPPDRSWEMGSPETILKHTTLMVRKSGDHHLGFLNIFWTINSGYSLIMFKSQGEKNGTMTSSSQTSTSANTTKNPDKIFQWCSLDDYWSHVIHW